MPVSIHLTFLHGGPGYRDYLRPFFNDAFAAPIECHFYDQAGGPEATVASQVQQLRDILGQQAGRRYLIGHSWGGALALEFLKTTGDKIDGLVLMDACTHRTGCFEDYEAEIQRLGIADDDIESIFFTEAEKPEGRALLEILNATFEEALCVRFENDYLTKFDLRETIRDLEIPVLNLYGSQDVRIPSTTLAKLDELNSNIRTAIIDGAGHFPFLLPANRDRVVARIAEFARQG